MYNDFFHEIETNYYYDFIIQGDPKQTVIFDQNTTLLWVNLGKRSTEYFNGTKTIFEIML